MSTHIQWTDETYNPWWGCTKVSEECEKCYAELLAARGIGIAGGPVKWGNRAPRRRNSPEYLTHPLKWNAKASRKGVRTKVFAASMADIFDNQVDPSWRADFWDVVRQCTNLDWQILTKRPQNIIEMLPPDWGAGWPHVWLGASVGNQRRGDERIPILSSVPAAVRFLSVEPLIGPVNLDLSRMGWVIGGGESGRDPRPMEPEWIRSVRDQCSAAGVPFFFKQWGGRKPKEAGRTLDGRTWDEFPVTPFSGNTIGREVRS